MEEIEFKYSHLKDPENCPIEELAKQVSELEALVGFYDTKQLAIKKFINSVYGALGSKYFVAHNTAIAESITAQGRDLNHFSENSVNRYFKGLFQSNPTITLYYQWVHHTDEGERFTFEKPDKPADYYNNGKWEECENWRPAVKKGKKLTADMKECLRDNSVGHCDWFMTSVDLFTKLGLVGEQREKAKNFDISKGMTNDYGELTGAEFNYLEGTRSMVVGGDTDSVSADSNIKISYSDTGSKKDIKVCDLFTELKYNNNDCVIITGNGSEVVPVKDICAQTYSTEKDKVIFRPVNYIMRHKVKKSRFRITTESGKQIIVTGDHSCMVVRDNELISVKAKDIKMSDKIITVDN